MEIVSAIIGGFLAGLSGILLIIFQDRRKKKELSKLFITGMRDDLNNSIPLYEKLKNTGKNQKFVPFDVIEGLRRSRQIFEKYSEHILLFDSPEIRRRIFDYYLKSGVLLNKLEGYQRRVYEIERMYNAVSNKIKSDEPHHSTNEVHQRRIQLLGNDASEYGFLKSITSDELDGLDSLRIEAQLLMDKLEM